MKKGAATEIEVLIYIIIMLFFMGIFLTLVSKSTEKNIAMNADTLELSKLSNTFDLMKRSLHTTWYVSTVQTLFTAGFDGLGCGFDSDSIGRGYWYQGTNSLSDSSKNVIFPVIFPSRAKAGEAFTIETYGMNNAADPVYAKFSCTVRNPDATQTEIISPDCVPIQPDSIQKLALSYSISEKETYSMSCRIDKYSDAACQAIIQEGENTAVPGSIEIANDVEYSGERKYLSGGGVQTICAPNNIIAAHFFNKTFSSYKYIERAAEANGIDISIGNDPKPDENTDIISNFIVSDSGIGNRVSHSVSLTASSSSLQTALESGIHIKTKFSDMIQNARDVVGFLAMMREKVLRGDVGYYYIPLLLDKTSGQMVHGDNEKEYAQRIYDKIMLIQPKDTIDIETAKNEMELVAMPNAQGIALHYDVDIMFFDKGRIQGQPIDSGLTRSGGIFGWSWPTDSTRVTSCFNEVRGSEKGRRFHKGLDIGSKERDDPDFVDDVKATGVIGNGDFRITVEETSTNCLSGDASCGKRYGNSVKLKHENGGLVYYSLYAHLKDVSVSLNQEVRPGDVIGTMGDTGDSRAKHLHFEIHDKDGNKLDPCDFIKCSDSTLDVCDFEGRADDDASIIPKIVNEGYYLYDEEANTFEKMPLQLHIKAEDYLPAIDCQKWNVPGLLFRLDDVYNIGCFPGTDKFLKIYTCGEANKIKDLAPESMKREGERVLVEDVASIKLYAVCTPEGWNSQPETAQP